MSDSLSKSLILTSASEGRVRIAKAFQPIHRHASRAQASAIIVRMAFATGNIVKRASRGGSMTKDQDDAIFAAFLGIMVLRTMCKKAGLKAAEQRSAELLIELDTAFSGLSGRSALRRTE